MILASSNFLPFLACIFISGSLWVLVQISKVDSYYFETPCYIENVPKSLKLSVEMPSIVRLKQNVTGINFLYEKLFQNEGYRFQYESLKIQRNLQGKKYFLLSETIKSNHIFSTFESAIPDTIYILEMHSFSKKIPVKFKLNSKLQEGCFITGKVIPFPSTVTIMGGKEHISGLDTLVFESDSKMPIISGDTHLVIGLANKFASKGIAIEPEKISFELNVATFTEKTLSLKIKAINVGDGKKVKLIPDVVVIKVSVPLDKFEKVDTDIFEVIADFGRPSINNRVRINLEKYPSYCKNVHLENNMVEFILMK